MAKLSARVEVSVPFHDVDSINVVWHGHYLKYFELARCALLRRFDYDYPQMVASGYQWPVVECYIKYVRPALYGHTLAVTATLLEYENRLKMGFEIRDVGSDQRLTKGYSVQVAVDARTHELQFVTPAIVIANIERASAC